MMIDLPKAYNALFPRICPLESVELPLEEALYRTLASPIRCDMDYPPFHRAVMDGFAVRSADVVDAPVRLRVIGRVAAGRNPPCPVGRGEAMQINTGAPVPEGADAVVRVEETEFDATSNNVLIRTGAPAGKFVTARGTYVKAGETVLDAGVELTPLAIAAAAAAGAASVQVYRRPKVAILCTGDELIPVDKKPTGAQIRDSNRHLLEALVRAAHAESVALPTAPDQRNVIEQRARDGLRCDVFCLTGGVSMGDTDFVPEVLRACGATIVIHKLAIKPGRPTIVATTDDGKLVFALPGNPASAFIGFMLLVRPALAALQGRPAAAPATVPAVLQGMVGRTSNRRTFVPASAMLDACGRWTVAPLAWHGSGDAFGMATANALIVRPPNARAAINGETVGILLVSP